MLEDLHYINKKIILDGYVQINKCSYKNFLEICHQLGSCELYSDIKIMADSQSYVTRSNTIPLHNDCPMINIIAWYCQRQDKNDGSSILADGDSLLSMLNFEIIDLLKNTEIYFPNYLVRKMQKTTILKNHGKKNILYYAPWLIVESNNINVKKLVNFIGELLREICFSTRLSAGEILIIDNQRMLHGRQAVTSDSKRILKRIWIKTHEY